MNFDARETLNKLHDVCSQIIGLYDEAMNLIESGESLENTFLLTKLKILITQENVLINSIPKSKLEYYLALIDKLAPDYLEEKYGITEEDLFCFDEDEKPNIRVRMRNRLFFTQQVQSGKCVTFDESLFGDSSNGEGN